VTHDPIPTTDIYDFLRGEGFVIVDPELATRRAKALEDLAEIDGPLWPGIADEVKDLERLLR
jgi:hypothetical protein